MRRFIFALFLLACLSACKKEHVEPVSGEAHISTLPKKVLISDGNINVYKIQEYEYNSHGLVRKICFYSTYAPNIQDSIVYSYNGSNKVAHMQSYYNKSNFNNKDVVQTYTYNNQGDLKTFCSNDSIYDYYYTAAGDVDYIIRHNALETFRDSIQMKPAGVWTYLGKGEGTLGATNDYREIIYEAFLNTDNGIYEDVAGPVWGTPSTNVPVCINKTIDFQNEVAYTIVPIGQAGYYNMWRRNTPYKYATHAAFVQGPMFNYAQYDATYTFDSHGRLKTIENHARGIDNSTPPYSIPLILDYTTTIQY